MANNFKFLEVLHKGQITLYFILSSIIRKTSSKDSRTIILAPLKIVIVVSGITLADPSNQETASLESTPTILNVPIRQPFRLTIVLLPQVLEVYMNGKLYGTKTFRYILKSTPSYFFGPPDMYRTSTRIMNVQYWDRPLNAREVRAAGPALPDVSLFGPLAPPGGTC